MKASTKELKAKLDAALEEVTLADAALEIALRELSSRPRAEKVTVTEVVTEAFARLRKARDELRACREMLDDD